DVGVVLGPLVDELDGQLGSHLAATNPHLVAVASLSDVDLSALADGYSLVWDATAERWVPSDVAGLSSSAVVLTAGGSMIRVPDGDATTEALVVRVPAGDRTALGAPDTLAIYWNAGTDEAPNW